MRLAGEDVTVWKPHRRSARGMCHVPEGRGVYRGLSVRDNLTMQAQKGSEARGRRPGGRRLPDPGRPDRPVGRHPQRWPATDARDGRGPRARSAAAPRRRGVARPRSDRRRRDLLVPRTVHCPRRVAPHRRPVRAPGAGHGHDRARPQPRRIASRGGRRTCSAPISSSSTSVAAPPDPRKRRSGQRRRGGVAAGAQERAGDGAR